MRLARRGLLAAVVAACCGAAAAADPPRPNVLLIVSDDQHWQDYGFAGHEHLRTPHLDRLARESLVFRRGYVTSSLCCPSLASIITGRYPHEHRIVGNDPPLPPGTTRGDAVGQAAFAAGRERMNAHLAAWPTLPQVLGGAGYRSLQTGKWWQGDFARGGFTEGMTKGGRHGDAGLAIGRSTLEPIKDFMARCREQSRPFFVWYAPMLPHTPHDPPEELVAHYRSRTDSVHQARYWANVERFDRTVGELLDHLDHAGLARDTLVVYVTDNGWIQSPISPRFAPRSKLSPYDGGLRTPIMLRRPGTIRPRESAGLASAIDIVPTVLAACALEPAADLPGVNLLDDAAVAARKQIFGACFSHEIVDLDKPARSLLWRWTVSVDDPHGPAWKLVVPADRPLPQAEARNVDPESRRRHEAGAAELFDVAADPGESRDLAAAHPDVVRDLRKRLDEWWCPVATPPNLLVFLADDLGWRDLGCTGSTFYRTPAIDRLAADGMRFTRAYASCPVCSPTRAALVTGRHPVRVGITNFIGRKAGTERRGRLLPAEYVRALPDDEVTVAELLRDVGFGTGVFGKWHLGPPADIPLHGFDVAACTTVGPGTGPADDPHHARAIAAAAADFIAAAGPRPFFCYVPLHSVHVPLASRADLVAEEKARAARLPPLAGPREVPEGDRTARGVQDLPVYAAMIREMDETVAAVLAALDAAGQRESTLVVFTSDNGGLATAEGSPTSNLPLRAGKGYLYEGGIRVPLIVRWPGVVMPGTTNDVPVSTLDLAATLIDAGGGRIAADTRLDGASLVPLLSGIGPPPSRDLVWHYPHYSNQGGRPAGALLAGDGPAPGSEKILEHFEDGRVEFFDLAADPGESRDLAAERPERVAELRGRLHAWRDRMGASMPRPDPEPDRGR